MTISFTPDNGPELPVETSADEQGNILERMAAKLLPEQDKREPYINTIEHGGTILLLDVEKVAALRLLDGDNQPVMRRLYADNASGIDADLMPALLRQVGKSTKPSTVYAGNHGMGLIIANGIKNPAGLVILSKTADTDEPYMAWVWKNPDSGHWALRTFWVPDANDPNSGTYEPVVLLTTVDGIDYAKVWKSAYHNVKFNGVPDSGTVIVEIGQHDRDSTYRSTQTTYNSDTDEWVFSRWAVGQYYNSRFWTLPIEVFWGVPGSNVKVTGRPPTFKGNTWGYRRATGLKGQIEVLTRTKKGHEDDEGVEESLPVVSGSKRIGNATCSATAEFYIRTLPAGVEARKLNFQVRRQAKVFIDYNGEIFEHPDPVTAHAQFGIVHPTLRANVWIRIIPDVLGKNQPGAVWMPNGRSDVEVIKSDGSSADPPWSEWGREFRSPVPDELAAAIRALDSVDIDSADALQDKRMKNWWKKFATAFKVKRPAPQPVVVASSGAESEVGATIIIGPGGIPRIRGGAHTGDSTGGGGAGGVDGDEVGDRRRAPGKGKKVGNNKTTEEEQERKEPTPPHIKWWMDEDDWVTDMKWGVFWEEPASTNDYLGKVHLNWNHWYIQQRFEELAGAKGQFRHVPDTVQRTMKHVYGLSAVSKIGHRLAEVKIRELGFTKTDIETIFGAPALTGFLLGIWDHDQRLLSSLGGATGGGSAGVEDDEAAEG